MKEAVQCYRTINEKRYYRNRCGTFLAIFHDKSSHVEGFINVKVVPVVFYRAYHTHAFNTYCLFNVVSSVQDFEQNTVFLGQNTVFLGQTYQCS